MQLGIKSVKLSDRDIKRIYFDAFPKNERMPFLMMVAMSKLWNTQFLSFCDVILGASSFDIHTFRTVLTFSDLFSPLPEADLLGNQTGLCSHNRTSWL